MTDDKENVKGTQLRVAIVGGGLAGIAVASVLSNYPNQFSIQVYEQQSKEGSQGYCISLRQLGVDALIEMGFKNLFRGVMKKLGNEVDCDLVFTQEDGRVYAVGKNWMRIEVDGEHYDAHVDRNLLRNALLETIANSSCCTVVFESGFQSYEEDNNHTAIKLKFENGTTQECDILIGCDGVRSKVRYQRCPILTPRFLNVWTTSGSLLLSSTVKNTSFTSSTIGNGEGPIASRSLHSTSRMSGRFGVSFIAYCYDRDGNKYLFWSCSMPADFASEHKVSEDDGMRQSVSVKLKKNPWTEVSVWKLVQVVKLAFDVQEIQDLIMRTQKRDFFATGLVESVNPSILKMNPMFTDNALGRGNQMTNTLVTLIGVK